jgi:DNA-binding MarR family transcriptional regulator
LTPAASDDGGAPQSPDETDKPLRLITSDIDVLSRLLDQLRAFPRVLGADPAGAGTRLRAAELIYEFRRFREEVFGGANFADPRWDMLLDLFIAGERGKAVSVSSVCIASAVPSTTALRHLQALVEHGFVERVSDETDARVVNVVLTLNGRDRMLRVLDALTASVAAAFQAPSFVGRSSA